MISFTPSYNPVNYVYFFQIDAEGSVDDIFAEVSKALDPLMAS